MITRDHPLVQKAKNASSWPRFGLNNLSARQGDEDLQDLSFVLFFLLGGEVHGFKAGGHSKCRASAQGEVISCCDLILGRN